MFFRTDAVLVYFTGIFGGDCLLSAALGFFFFNMTSSMEPFSFIVGEAVDIVFVGDFKAAEGGISLDILDAFDILETLEE